MRISAICEVSHEHLTSAVNLLQFPSSSPFESCERMFVNAHNQRCCPACMLCMCADACGMWASRGSDLRT